MNKKAVIICPYSYPSACGVWKRAFEDAKALQSAGYDVFIFSSNIIKGTNTMSESIDSFENIEVYRFNVLFSLGGTSMFWFPFKKLKEINPDLIHTHGFRHPHSLFSLIWGKLNRKKVVLTTHAPFKKDHRRPFLLKIIDIIYDLLIARIELRFYDGVIRISKWEEIYLKKLGVKDSIYIPNGISKSIISKKKTLPTKPLNKIIFMGRIDPVKRVEWILDVAKFFKNKNFLIIGPVQGYKFENNYLNEHKIPKNVKLINKTYNLDEFIENVSKSDIFVLPSIREAQSIALLEAMGLSRIVVSSNNQGAQDFLVNGKNGFLASNLEEFKNKISYVYENWIDMKKISYQAYETAKEFQKEKLNKKYIKFIHEKILKTN
ncbi:MAG: glycosyl transferase family 1 [Candidatus Dojkabacteria bacterium]|nr:MAG: glycosyl transferase family 1 [Candidatus Dojkabacteria bacterium]